MNVTLNQLRAFQQIVRLGSFHAAAQELNLSQPSVSQRVRELESTLQTVLFTRRGPRVQLTADGHALVEYAERALRVANEMAVRFRSRDPLAGTLRLGLSESFALVCLPELLMRLEQRYPAIRASVFVGDTIVMSQRLNSQELDIAVVSEPAVEAHVSQELIGTNSFAWAVSASAKLPRRVLTPADLLDHHLVVPPPPSRLHESVGKWFAAAGVRPTRVSTCNSISATLLTVLHGAAVGILPTRLAQEEVAQRRIKLLRVTPPFPVHRVAICYQASEFGASIEALVKLMRELVERHKLFV